MGSEFGESDSEEYRGMVRRDAGFLVYVDSALNLCWDAGAADEKVREFMPDPIKSRQQLTRFCSSSSGNQEASGTNELLRRFRELEAVEKQACGKYPALHAFLAQRHVIARRFLMTPLLAAVFNKHWKAYKGFWEWQSWAFLEYSRPKVRAWIARKLPRSCASRSTAEVARLMDDVERMLDAWGVGRSECRCSMRDVESSGILDEEWVSDDPLALVALELIKSWEAKRLKTRTSSKARSSSSSRLCKPFVYDDDEKQIEQSVKPFAALESGHLLRYASIRVIGLKLLSRYILAGHHHPEVQLQPGIQAFERRAQLVVMLRMLRSSLGLMGVWEVDEDANDGNHIEDLLEDASLLLESGQVCSCCSASFKAIVECSRIYSLPLAKVRLPQLAGGVLRNWEKPGNAKLWIDTLEPPFPAPVLDELERIPVTGPPGGLEHYVGQYRKAKAYGLVMKPEEYNGDPLMRTSVEVLDKAEAELAIQLEDGEVESTWVLVPAVDDMNL